VRDANSRHLFQESDRARANALNAAKGANSFGGRRLHGDERTYDGREFAGHPGHERGQFGTLGNDRDVGRDRAQAGRRDEGDRLFEQSTRRRTLELRSVSGKWRPKSPRLAAPSRASQSACVATSASEWPTSPGASGISTRPSQSGRVASSLTRCTSSPWPILIGAARSTKPWRDRPAR